MEDSKSIRMELERILERVKEIENQLRQEILLQVTHVTQVSEEDVYCISDAEMPPKKRMKKE
jgi:hypothetical protein